MALINTLDRPSEFDAAAKLREGEPYFLLVGRDKLAPGLILRWASYNRRKALREHDAGLISDARLNDELRKSTDAEEIAWDMQAFKKGWKREAETDTAPPPSYTGAKLSEDTQRRDRVQRARTKAAERVNGAAAELNDLVEVLIRDGDSGTDDVRSLAEEAVPNLQKLSTALAVPRPVFNR
jgi:hypothetical protein